MNSLITYDRKVVKFDVEKLGEAHRQLREIGKLKKAAVSAHDTCLPITFSGEAGCGGWTIVRRQY